MKYSYRVLLLQVLIFLLTMLHGVLKSKQKVVNCLSSARFSAAVKQTAKLIGHFVIPDQ